MARKSRTQSLDHLGPRKAPFAGTQPNHAPKPEIDAPPRTGQWKASPVQPVDPPTGPARYVIAFDLRLTSPLHLGSAGERAMSDAEAPAGMDKAERPWVTTIVRNLDGVPCIPGASLKGALLARALRSGQPQDPDFADVLYRVFGQQLEDAVEGQANTRPGSAEFNYAVAIGLPAEFIEARTAIDRVTCTVVDGKLFHQETVEPGATFKARVVFPRSRSADVAVMAALLGGCTYDHPLNLGAHGRAGWGHAIVEQVDARVLTADGLETWWSLPLDDEAGRPSDWLDFTRPVRLPQVTLAKAPSLLSMALQIKFDGPFAVRDPSHRKSVRDPAIPDVRARQRGARGGPDERPLLPSTSFLGTLRSQAERILRTLGLATAQGHDAPRATAGEPPEDLASLLFGCTGWRGVVGVGAEFAGTAATERIEQDMIALCRITGRVKNGAKFKIAGWASPRLDGTLTLDAVRLKASPRYVAALGLLRLVMLDLSDGDISFGLGRSKGWGWVTPDPGPAGSALRDLLRDALGSDQLPQGTDPAAHCVASLAALAPQPVTPPIALPTRDATTSKAASAAELPTLSRGPGRTGGEFHNPYHFLPFARLHGAPAEGRDATARDQAARLGHGHDRYAADRFNGRLTVDLVTVTPLFIGAARREGAAADEPVTVDPFEFDNQRAIPGTSLRGMISALLEPMSGSAMRVLDDDAMISVRMAARAREFLPYKGVVVDAVDEDDLPALAVEELVDDGRGEARLWPIGPQAIEMLHALADERWNAKGKDLDLDDPRVKEQSKRFVPPAERVDRKGRADSTRKGNLDLLPAIDWLDGADHSLQRNPDPKRLGTKARLMAGQIVYFDLDPAGEFVQELAWSALYRRSKWSAATCDPGPLNIRRFVGLDEHERGRLPLGRRDGQDLHPAEWLLGVVQDNVDEGTSGSAFAAKVAVGMGRATTASIKTLGPIPLKELSSPKPPSPALYIRRTDHTNRRVRKDELVRDPGRFRFHGTKTYLHAWQPQGKVEPLDENGVATGTAMPWESLRPRHAASNSERDKDYHLSKRQVRVDPIAAGQTFSFDIRFDNLSADELSLLCAALRPSAPFVHRLGMGRPIGMGSVKLTMKSLALEDRVHRYRTGKPAPVTSNVDPSALAEQGAAALQRRDPALFSALLALGDPRNVKAPVHYPQVAGERIEDRNYQWWVENDKLPDATAQALAPIATRSPHR